MPPTPIAFDTETHLIGPALKAPPLVCLSYAEGANAGLERHDTAREMFEVFLESDRVLVGHNVAFDFGVCAAKWPDLLPSIFDKYERDQVTDTMLRQQLIDIAATRRAPHPQSLAELSRRWLGVTLDKGEDTWRLRYGELHDVPLADWPQDAKAYAVDDARATLAVWLQQETQDLHLLDEYRQARAAWWLHLMSSWGLRTDPVAVEALAERLQTQHEALKSELVTGGLMRPNGVRDTKAAHARMLAVVEDPELSPKTKNPKLDKDACDSSGDPLLQAYAKVSSVKTRIGNYVKLLRRGLIHANFNSLLETGRTSSSPNVQNLPRKGGERECFVPRPGHVFIAADYSQFELRTVSQVMISLLGLRPKLAAALNAGIDPHLEIARRIVECSYDDAATRLAAGDDEVDLARQVGKVANFGFPGGLGIGRFVHYARNQYGVIITEAKAAELKEYWFQAWPEFEAYFRWVGVQCDSGPAKFEQAFVGRFRGGCSYCEACNTMFQGLAADAAKRAGFMIAKACYVERASPLFGVRPVNFPHDEFIAEVLEARAPEAAEELARLMVVGASVYLPDVPPLAEAYIMRRWSKKAKPVRGADGRLAVWEP